MFFPLCIVSYSYSIWYGSQQRRINIKENPVLIIRPVIRIFLFWRILFFTFFNCPIHFFLLLDSFFAGKRHYTATHAHTLFARYFFLSFSLSPDLPGALLFFTLLELCLKSASYYFFAQKYGGMWGGRSRFGWLKIFLAHFRFFFFFLNCFVCLEVLLYVIFLLL